MKSSYHLAVCLFLSGACLPEESPIKLGPAFPLSGTAPQPGQQTTCTINNAVSQGGGSLDLSATVVYDIAFGTISDLVAPQITDSNGRPVGSSTDNDFVFTQVLLTYTATPTLALQAEQIDFSGVIPAGASSPGSWIRMDPLGPKAVQALVPAVAGGNAENVEITLQLKGHTRAGQDPMLSNHFTFPLTVYSSGFPGCPAGVSNLPSGPCGDLGGQDGTIVGCCPTDGGTFTGCP